MQELLPWRLLFLAAITLAIAAELVAVSTRTVRNLAQAKGRRNNKIGEDPLNSEPPDIPRTISAAEKLQKERANYIQEIRAERSRGLGWLAAITVAAIWCTGILFKENALQP